MCAVAERVFSQTTQHQDTAIFHHHIRLNRLLGGGWAVGIAGGIAFDARIFLEDLQAHLPVFADLRFDAQRQTHIFALNRLKGIGCAATAGTRVGELPRHEGHITPHHDLGFFVVQGEQIRR